MSIPISSITCTACGFRPRGARLAASAEGIEIILAEKAQQAFGHLGARTIAGAEEEDTESVSHGRLLE